MGVYTEAWNTYKARRNAALALFFTEIIFVSVYANSTSNTVTSGIGLAGIFVCIPILSYVLWLLHQWPCPHCGHRFVVGSWTSPLISVISLPFSKKCPQCGMTKYAIIANS
jgi:hypothetical protein